MGIIGIIDWQYLSLSKNDGQLRVKIRSLARRCSQIIRRLKHPLKPAETLVGTQAFFGTRVLPSQRPFQVPKNGVCSERGLLITSAENCQVKSSSVKQAPPVIVHMWLGLENQP